LPIKAAPPKSATPRQSSTAKNAAAAQTAYQSQHDKRVEGVEGAFQAAGLILLIRKQYADAGAIGQHAHPIAEELASIADTNEKLAKWLDYFSVAGPYAGLVKASLPLLLQLMANHGTIPAEAGAMFGVVSPDLLVLKGKADQALVEVALKLQIEEAQKEAADITEQLRKEPANDAS
jgi:hypothetical protein